LVCVGALTTEKPTKMSPHLKGQEMIKLMHKEGLKSDRNCMRPTPTP
jgi:hypothetical protein